MGGHSKDTKELDPMVQRAWLVGISDHETSFELAEALCDELQELVANLGIETVGRSIVKIREPSAAYFLGQGKAEEIIQTVQGEEADCLIFDKSLSPAQQRNWEKACGGKILVIDRQEIILDIFSSRARTREARLQIELARLEYELPRMKRAWSHLDRQRGGGAVQRDAGETQLEMDQRLIRQRISRLKSDLSDVVRRREVQRRQRRRVPLPTAAIVGYTNAGKSSLLNRLCASADILAEDKLFATLDPTTRRCRLPSGQTLLLTDTVGFIRRLPHRLVEAFKATLEEAVVSDVLIHVLDASSPDVLAHFETTQAVLAELHSSEKEMIVVLNKIDASEDRVQLAAMENAFEGACLISVKTGEGLEALLHRCEAAIANFSQPLELLVPYPDYELVSRLHEAGAVVETRSDEAGVWISGNIPHRLIDAVSPFIARSGELRNQ